MLQNGSNQTDKSFRYERNFGQPGVWTLIADQKTNEINGACMRMAREFHLTTRELELIMHLTMYGSSNKELANALVVTEKTVKTHMSNIQRKTNTTSTRELLSLVIKSALHA